jgi:hypothetical protein
MVDPWLAKHKTIIAVNYLSQRMEGEILEEHNSSFVRWFKEQLTAKPPPMNSDKNKLLFTGPIQKEVVGRDQLIFKHNTTFPCLKQPTNSSRDSYYAIHQMFGVRTGSTSDSVVE